MRPVVTVAPREIHDLVSQASRVAGCDPGTADRIAHNVTVAEICLGAGASAFRETLASADVSCSAWATAPDAVLAAEAAAQAGGEGTATFEAGTPFAAIIGTLCHSLQRGVAVVEIDGRRSDDMVLDTINAAASAGISAAGSRHTADGTASTAGRLRASTAVHVITLRCIGTADDPDVRSEHSEAAAARRARLLDAMRGGYRDGLDVDRDCFAALKAAAAKFQVPEAAIDAVS